MNKQMITKAMNFLEEIDLPMAPRRRRSAIDASVDLTEEIKKQSLVVGSDLVSFAPDISNDDRALVVNSSLLAQLAANKKVPDRSQISEWYDVYFDTLANIGWVTQERGFSEHAESGDNFEANKAILSVASVVFGPASTALAIVTSTLHAMQSMSKGPWITIFNRESQTANAGRFQVTVCEKGTNGELIIAMMTFKFEAKTNLLQILFFKFRSADIKLWHASGRVAVNKALLTALAPVVASKVEDFALSFIRALDI